MQWVGEGKGGEEITRTGTALCPPSWSAQRIHRDIVMVEKNRSAQACNCMAQCETTNRWRLLGEKNGGDSERGQKCDYGGLLFGREVVREQEGFV